MIANSADGGGIERMKLARDRAEVLALQALAFCASDKDLLPRFLALTGMDVDGLRTAAGETGTLIAVMDFVMFDDTLVGRFANLRVWSQTLPAVRCLAGPEVDPTQIRKKNDR